MIKAFLDNRWLLLGLSTMLLLPLVVTTLAFGTLATTQANELVAGTPLVLTARPRAISTPVLTPTPDPDALFATGLAAYRVGDLELAEDSVRATLDLVPEEATVHNALGLVLMAQDRPREAVVAFGRALQLDPTLVEAHFNLGTLYHNQERWSDARAAYQRALDLAPRFLEAYTALGTLFLDQERYDDAVLTYEKGVTLAPDNVNARRNLALALVAAGNVAEATTRLEEAFSRHPDDPGLRYDLALLYARQGNTSDARALLTSILTSEPAGTIWADRAAKQLQELARFE